MRAYLLVGIVTSLLGISKLLETETTNGKFDFGNISAIDTAKLLWTYKEIPMDRASTYYPSLEQCARRDSLGNIDSSSNIYTTADGSFINMEKLRKKEIQWCALPKSMIVELGGEPFHFGDTIPFESCFKPHINGDWVLHDVVSSSWGKTVDFLVHPENNRNPKLGICTDVVILYNKKPKYKRPDA